MLCHALQELGNSGGFRHRNEMPDLAIFGLESLLSGAKGRYLSNLWTEGFGGTMKI